MKKTLPFATVLLVASLLSVVAIAADQPPTMKMNMKAHSSGLTAKHGKTAGTVTAVDPSRSSVTISHQPVGSLGWPAMTMTFKTTARQLGDIKTGDHVGIEFDVKSGGPVITKSAKCTKYASSARLRRTLAWRQLLSRSGAPRGIRLLGLDDRTSHSSCAILRAAL